MAYSLSREHASHRHSGMNSDSDGERIQYRVHPPTKKYYVFVRLSFADRPGVRCSIHRSNNIATTHTGNRFMHAYIMRHNLYSRVSFLSLRTKWL